MTPPRLPRADHTHVLLLRGINVGGRNRVPREDLVRWAAESGAEDVSTHLASGNVLFRLTGESPDVVARGVREAAWGERGLDVPVLWASTQEMREALVELAALPWGADPEPRLTVLTLLEREPEDGAEERLAALDHGPDRSALIGRHLWLRHATGVADSPLTLVRLERALGVTGTARNLATVRVLAGVRDDPPGSGD